MSCDTLKFKAHEIKSLPLCILHKYQIFLRNIVVHLSVTTIVCHVFSDARYVNSGSKCPLLYYNYNIVSMVIQ